MTRQEWVARARALVARLEEAGEDHLNPDEVEALVLLKEELGG